MLLGPSGQPISSAKVEEAVKDRITDLLDSAREHFKEKNITGQELLIVSINWIIQFTQAGRPLPEECMQRCQLAINQLDQALGQSLQAYTEQVKIAGALNGQVQAQKA